MPYVHNDRSQILIPRSTTSIAEKTSFDLCLQISISKNETICFAIHSTLNRIAFSDSVLKDDKIENKFISVSPGNWAGGSTPQEFLDGGILYRDDYVFLSGKLNGKTLY